MQVIHMTKIQARRFLTNHQGLSDDHQFNNIVDYIKKVGCIQYDPLNVVGRNADLVLQSRFEDYSSSKLETLLYTDRSLIDGWDKMMAIYHRDDWPSFQRVRDRHSETVIHVMRNRGTLKALEVLDEVRELAKTNGPIMARDIKIGSGTKGRWGTGKHSSVALDYLYHLGELSIHSKKNAQKVFEQTDKLLDVDLIESIDPFLNDRAFLKWYLKRRINSVGMLWAKNGGAWLGYFISNKSQREMMIKELVAEKALITIKVERIEDCFYINAENYETVNKQSDQSKNTRFIAPLDNMLWDRDLIDQLFDFKYSWEVYVPKDKRRYGYYVLPVLYEDRFIARFEPEKYRGEEQLEIKNWWWEDSVEMTDEIRYSVVQALNRFCKYLGAESVSKESMTLIFSQSTIG